MEIQVECFGSVILELKQKNYDRFMADMVKEMLIFAPIIHILFAVGLFGTPFAGD